MKPKKPDVTHILEPYIGPKKHVNIVACIDISGTMCLSYKIDKKNYSIGGRKEFLEYG